MKKLTQILLNAVIRPTLAELDKVIGSKGKLNTKAAERLILMIIAHESGTLTYSKQVRGPALGFTQMEPATFNWLTEWLEAHRPHLLDALTKVSPVPRELSAESMVVCPKFAVAAARLNLLRFPEALPHEDDLEGMAAYAKKYWNTVAGKATAEDYLNAYKGMVS